MIMHDQEPLDHTRYNQHVLENSLSSWFEKNFTSREVYFNNNSSTRDYLVQQNLAALFDGIFIKDRHILVHSELNSSEVKRYQHYGFETVYWWSHALIALDWYRFAAHDLKLCNNNTSFNFNIYNRAWSGSREYRIKFADLLIEHNLIDCCNTAFSTIDNNVHYSDHIFKNPKFTPNNNLSVFAANSSSSSSSASYNVTEYNNCWIDVVLETVFDDTRLHLTEKILRPIACKKPFILAAAPGSLEYLRSYGFKTYSSVFSEEYDNITCSSDRLLEITNLMQHIASLSSTKKYAMQQKCNDIALFNHNRFFSNEFFNQVVSEFKTNYAAAHNNTNLHKNAALWFNFYKQCQDTPITKKLTNTANEFRGRTDIANLIRHYRKNK